MSITETGAASIGYRAAPAVMAGLVLARPGHLGLDCEAVATTTVMPATSAGMTPESML